MIREQAVELPTPDGRTDAQLFLPDGGGAPCPAVLVLTDLFGPRAAFDQIARRIAGWDLAVLVPNIFYRTTRPPAFDHTPDFSTDRTRARQRELTAPLTPDAMARDGRAWLDWLDRRPEVRPGGFAVVGFCFSGQFALRVAAAAPERIRAAASFHGGGLATGTPQSPHLQLPQVRARLYFGHAEQDSSMPTDAIERLNATLAAWGGQYGSEVYPARHGWMVPDRPAYDERQATRGWERLEALLRASLP